jgi:hypothetical protein
MSNGISKIGFGNNDSDLDSKTKNFKAKEGEKYRISFAWWPGSEEGKPNLGKADESPSPEFIAGKRLYLAGVGYFLDKGPEYSKLAGSQSRRQVGTIIVVWPVDSKGQVDKAKFQENKWQVLPWIFAADKYRTIEQNHIEFPLSMHDLNLSCTDTQYQKMTMSPARENLFRKLLDGAPERAKLIIDQVRELIETLPSQFAQDLTIDQIKAKLAGANGGGGGGRGPGGGGVATNSKELDGMLDDILSS